jgi:hypothetical protein
VIAQRKVIEKKRMRLEKQQAKKDAEFFTEQVRKANHQLKRANKKRKSAPTDDDNDDDDDDNFNLDINNKNDSNDNDNDSINNNVKQKKKKKKMVLSEGFQLFAPSDNNDANAGARKTRHVDLLAAARTSDTPRTTSQASASSATSSLLDKLLK